MIEYELEFTQEALDDIKRHQKSGNKPLLKKLEKLLLKLKQHPDTWSRRINDEHRLIYRIKEKVNRFRLNPSVCKATKKRQRN